MFDYSLLLTMVPNASSQGDPVIFESLTKSGFLELEKAATDVWDLRRIVWCQCPRKSRDGQIF